MKWFIFLALCLLPIFSSAETCDDLFYKAYIPKIKSTFSALCKGGFIIFYSTEKSRPILALEKINPVTVKMSILPRRDNFKLDPTINDDFQPSVKALAGTDYHRGHLVPAEDMAFDHEYLANTFMMTNIIPQYSDHNTGIWKSLENKVRKLAKDEELYVITGPIYKKTILLEDKIAIPTSLFKIIVRPSSNEVFCYNIPNEANIKTKDLNKYGCTIKKIIASTEVIRFFPLSVKFKENSYLK